MNHKQKLHFLQFAESSVAYLIVFISICVSIGFSKNFLMIFNGVFFIIYILSLWKTGMDTLDFYDSKYFITDLLSIAIFANIPILFIKQLSQRDFVCLCLVLLALNETICIFWDYLCHNKSERQGQRFYLKWTILTAFGILIMLISTLLIYFMDLFDSAYFLISIDIFNIGYQLALLIAWWYSEYRLKKDHK